MEQREEIELDLLDLLATVWRNKIQIIAVALLFAIVAFVATYFFITPMYASKATMYVLNQTEGNLTSSDVSVSTSLTSDFEILITSRSVMEEVLRQTEVEMSMDALVQSISVNNPNGTRSLEIVVKHEDPAMAKRIADSVADISSEKIVALMGIDKVNVVDYGNLPIKPASPSMKKNVILGGAAGLLLAVAVVLLVHILDDTIKTAEEAEKFLEASVLSAIPLNEEAGQGSKKKRRNPFTLLKRKMNNLSQRR